MLTRLCFRSTELFNEDVSDFDPDGRVLAEYLAPRLPAYGFAVRDMVMEDWGWVIVVENPRFYLWIGCGFSGESDDGLHCFIEPHRPVVWRWFRRVRTTERVQALAKAIESIIEQSGMATELRWERATAS